MTTDPIKSVRGKKRTHVAKSPFSRCISAATVREFFVADFANYSLSEQKQRFVGGIEKVC